MISFDATARSALKGSVVAPVAGLYLRRLHPGWTLIANNANGIPETPDIVGGSAVLGAAGTWTGGYGGWRLPIGGDSVETATRIYRIIAPKAYDATDTKWYLYDVNTATTASQWTTAIATKTPTGNDVQMARTRGGLNSGTSSTATYFYVRADGQIGKQAISGSAFSGSVTVVTGSNRYSGVLGAAVAPINDNNFYVCYLKPADRNLYLDYYVGSAYVFTDTILAQVPEIEPDWTLTHWFDAAEYGGRHYVVANASLRGNSKLFWVQDGALSEAASPLSTEDLDWTAVTRIASLSIAHNRLYACAWQRFLASDDYSQPLISLIWTNNGLHWAQPRFLAVTTENTAGKVMVRNDKVCLVGSGNVWVGERTVDFGGSDTNVQQDASAAMSRYSYARRIDSGGQFELTLDTDALSLLQSQTTWLPYSQQMVLRLGIPGYVSNLAVGWIDQPESSYLDTERKMILRGRGSYSRLLDATQFTDEILWPGIEQRFDMDENNLINRGGSVWTTRKGTLWTDLPNPNNESIAVGVSPFPASGWEMKARLVYESQALAFGLILGAGIEAKDPQDEASDHNFLYLRFDNKGNGTVDMTLRQRTGVLKEGVWVESDQALTNVVNLAWPHSTYRILRVSMQNYTIRVWYWNGSTWTKVLTWAANRFLPKRALLGLYGKGAEARVVESQSADEQTIVANDIGDWPATGYFRLDDHTYKYTRVDNTLTLVEQKLHRYISLGDVLVLSDSAVGCDWLTLASSSPRWSVADIVQRLSMRAGIWLDPDSKCSAIDNWTPMGSPLPQWDSDLAVWNLDDGGYLRSDAQVTSFVAEIYYQNLEADSNEYIELGTETIGGRLRWNAAWNAHEISIWQGGTSLAASPIDAAMTEQGWLRVVFSQNWCHFYLNRVHVGSLYHPLLKPELGYLCVRGNGVIPREVELNVGCEIIAPGVWDAQSSARAVLERIMQGRDLVITENADVTLRLQQALVHDSLGELSLNQAWQFGHGATWLIPSAVVLEGGYEWDIQIDEALLRQAGLLWQRVENHSLLHSEEMRQYGSSYFRRLRGNLYASRMTGRGDPAMAPNDSFTLATWQGHSSRSYVVEGVTIEGSDTILNFSVDAVGAPAAITPMIWDTDSWNSKEWG